MKPTLVWLAPLFSPRSSALAGLLKNAFEDLKFFCVSIGKYSADFRGMLAENGIIRSLHLCKRDNSNPAIFGAFRPADQPFFEQAIDGDADGSWSEVDFRSYRVHRQGPLMQKDSSTRKSVSEMPVSSIPLYR